MKRKIWIILLCCLLVLTMCAGCKKPATTNPPKENNDQTPDNGTADDKNPVPDTPNPPSLGDVVEVTAAKLYGLIGKMDTDIKTVLGENATVSDSAAANPEYKTKVLGKDAAITFKKAGDKTIESVVVTVNKNDAQTMMDDLEKQYGKNTNDIWEKDDTHIQKTTVGDNVVFTITKVKK